MRFRGRACGSLPQTPTHRPRTANTVYSCDLCRFVVHKAIHHPIPYRSYLLSADGYELVKVHISGAVLVRRGHKLCGFSLRHLHTEGHA